MDRRIFLIVIVLVVLGAGIYFLLFNFNKVAMPFSSPVTDKSEVAPTISYLVSNEDTTKYCNGADMDSEGYRKTITVEKTMAPAEANPTRLQIIKETIGAATDGMCKTALEQTAITENNGVVTIGPIGAWAGVSITMCSCQPQVEVNLLNIPGITKVSWSGGQVPSEPDSKADLIRVTSLKANDKISSPLVITGEARGTWFFEASFPVVVVDWDGKIIGQGIAQAKSDWMTTEFVPFEAKVNFTVDPQAYSNKGAVILRKDNPSGLPKNDDALEIPVILTGAPNQTACTMEAKICPDGSAVGRSGPNCEFAPCPTTQK